VIGLIEAAFIIPPRDISTSESDSKPMLELIVASIVSLNSPYEAVTDENNRSCLNPKV
jgi:hypothetical protein